MYDYYQVNAKYEIGLLTPFTNVSGRRTASMKHSDIFISNNVINFHFFSH